MTLRNYLVAIAGAAWLVPTASAATPFEPAFTQFAEAMSRDPSAPPGFAVVAVENGRTVFARAFGSRNLDSDVPLDLDTPMYTASVTKAYVGLLASHLDAAGDLKLGATLSQVWPGLTLPAPHDPARITAAALLSHSSGIEDGGLGWRYGLTGEYRSADVPGHLARYATAANRAFDYGNFGPVIYTAMAEQRTGLDWRQQLRRFVFEPLKLKRTSARLDDLPTADVARCHTRTGDRWRTVLKPDATLNAGGGVYTSPRDAATFLAAFTSDGRSTAGAFDNAVLARTYERFSVQERDFFGFQRTGYGLGWDLSTYAGKRVVSRSGGYAGCRALMAFLPDRGFGVVVLSLSDSGANLFNSTLVQQAFDIWSGDPAAAVNGEKRVARFATEAAKAIAEADAAALPAWPQPLPRGGDYVGWYENERLGRMAITLTPDGLVASAGVMTLRLTPRGGDAFQAVDVATYERIEPARFRRDAAGRAAAFILDDDEFRRLP